MASYTMASRHTLRACHIVAVVNTILSKVFHAKELQRICKYAPVTTTMPLLNVGGKKFKKLQQHNITKNVLSKVWAYRPFPSSRAWFALLDVAIHALNQSLVVALSASATRRALCLRCTVINVCSMGHCRGMKVSQNMCLEKELPQWCVVILVPTLLCAYPLVLTSLRRPFSKQAFV